MAALRETIQQALEEPGAAAFVGIAYPDGGSLIWQANANPALLDLARRLPGNLLGEALVKPSRLSLEWVWADITGEGPRWHLAAPGCQAGHGTEDLWFPLEDFADDAANYTECPRLPLAPPPPPAGGFRRW